MRKIRTYHEVDSGAGRELLDQVLAQRRRVDERLDSVASVVAVASGKGGVGKSALTANLAAALAARGRRVGALDADLNGPSLARMTGVTGSQLADGAEGVGPATGAGGVLVMSMELLQEDEDTPLRWKSSAGHVAIRQSAAEAGALREFLSDVAWGELDVLLIDAPPGTDKLHRLLELLPNIDQVLLVTTPSEMACRVVARSARLLAEAEVPTALVANMTEHVCPNCGHTTVLWESDGVDKLATQTGLPVWSRVPFDPRLASTTDAGTPWVLDEIEAPTAAALVALADRVDQRILGDREAGATRSDVASPRGPAPTAGNEEPP